MPAFFKKFRHQIKMTREEADYLALNGMPVRGLGVYWRCLLALCVINGAPH